MRVWVFLFFTGIHRGKRDEHERWREVNPGGCGERFLPTSGVECLFCCLETIARVCAEEGRCFWAGMACGPQQQNVAVTSSRSCSLSESLETCLRYNCSNEPDCVALCACYVS